MNVPFLREQRSVSMYVLHRLTARTIFSIYFVLMLQAAGAVRAQEKPNKYVDDKFDFSITVAPPWKDARLQDYTVPGVARAAFARPGGASIVVFVQEPGKAFEPRFLVDESAKSMEKALGATIQSKLVRLVAEKQAMWLVIEGKGTGGAIDGKGTVATAQHWVAIPREKDIVVALLTCPAAQFAEYKKSFEESINTMVVGGKQTSAQLESK